MSPEREPRRDRRCSATARSRQLTRRSWRTGGCGTGLHRQAQPERVRLFGPRLNPNFGTPVNPNDSKEKRSPGGSSSGCGVAVAARLVPIAIGTDTGGSVRIPAAFNGVTGFKTSHGRKSTPMASRRFQRRSTRSVRSPGPSRLHPCRHDPSRGGDQPGAARRTGLNNALSRLRMSCSTSPSRRSRPITSAASMPWSTAASRCGANGCRCSTRC